MATFGSVFLGDVQRLRLLSSSTPPSSPPPGHSPAGAVSFFGAGPHSRSHLEEEIDGLVTPTSVDPVLSLQMRIRWLEALILGVHHNQHASSSTQAAPLVRLAGDVQRKLGSVVESNEGLKRFIDHYDQYAHLLTPAFGFGLSGSGDDVPSYDNMSPAELDAFLIEMEPDIRAADRDMREIEELEKKGVTGSGQLLDYEELQPRLQTLTKAHEEDLKLAEDLESRIQALVQRHTGYVDALSELFIAWDDSITEAEDRVAKMERDRDERRRLGLE